MQPERDKIHEEPVCDGSMHMLWLDQHAWELIQWFCRKWWEGRPSCFLSSSDSHRTLAQLSILPFHTFCSQVLLQMHTSFNSNVCFKDFNWRVRFSSQPRVISNSDLSLLLVSPLPISLPGLPCWLRWWRLHLQCGSPGWGDPLEEGMAAHSSTLPGESHGQRSLMGYSPRGCKE